MIGQGMELRDFLVLHRLWLHGAGQWSRLGVQGCILCEVAECLGATHG